MSEYQMVAKTFKGLEEVLAKELVDLGANNVQIERRAVSFVGDKALMYRANLELRTASRVLKPILSFKAKDADEVYEEVKKLEWDELLDQDTTFAIDATVYSETFRHSAYVTYRVKDAIADYFMEKTGKRPSVKVSNPDVMINVHVADQLVTVSMDSSGESLHKRGWREATTEAPINEALAAGMLLMAGWTGQCDLYDPMCGSGTFLIEAAMIALGIAPGIYRKSFAFEKWKDFDEELFSEVYNDDSREREFTHHIYGSDASFYCTKVTEKNIQSAQLGKYVSVRMCRMQDLKPETQNALVMINPPYGERLKAGEEVLTLYREIGDTLKHQFAGSTAWIISSNEDAMKCIGLKPSQRIPLLNGELECKFNCYEMFAGEHKEYKKDLAEGKIERREKSEYQHHKYEGKKRPARPAARRDDKPRGDRFEKKEGRFSREERSQRGAKNGVKGGKRGYGKDTHR